MILLVRFFSRWPLWALYQLANVIFLLAYYGLRYRRRVVGENLCRAFPDKSPAEIRQIARRFYIHLAEVMVEIVKGYRIGPEALARRITIRNPEVLGNYLKKGTSVITMTGHSGNWEWILLRCASHFQLPADAIYKPLSNPAAEKLMLHIRSRFGGHPIPMKKTLREIIQRREIVRMFATVADQCPHQSEKVLWTRFLGLDTAFYTGTEKIAQMTKYPVLFVGMHRLRRGYYEIYFEPLAAPPYPAEAQFIIEHYAQALERLVRAEPENWLWSHKRWKYPKPNAAPQAQAAG